MTWRFPDFAITSEIVQPYISVLCIIVQHTDIQNLISAFTGSKSSYKSSKLFKKVLHRTTSLLPLDIIQNYLPWFTMQIKYAILVPALCALHLRIEILTYDRRVRTLTGKEIDLGKTLTDQLFLRSLVGRTEDSKLPATPLTFTLLVMRYR